MNKKSFKALYPKINEDELDLLSKLLKFNPNKRIDVNKTLEHNYAKEFHSQYTGTEIIWDKHMHAPMDGNVKYYHKKYRKKLYDEALKRKKEIRKKIMAKISIFCLIR